jgi:hypothetical protein
MSKQNTTQIADVLHRAHEQRDAEAMIALYADDAEVRIVDSSRPPRRPLVLRGKQAISELLRDINSRPMTHRIEQKVVGENALSLTVACEYSEGTRVLATEVYELQNGKIVRQVTVQAWDQ